MKFVSDIYDIRTEATCIIYFSGGDIERMIYRILDTALYF